jgi:hypothetical protein
MAESSELPDYHVCTLRLPGEKLAYNKLMAVPIEAEYHHIVLDEHAFRYSKLPLPVVGEGWGEGNDL